MCKILCKEYNLSAAVGKNVFCEDYTQLGKNIFCVEYIRLGKLWEALFLIEVSAAVGSFSLMDSVFATAIPLDDADNDQDEE